MAPVSVPVATPGAGAVVDVTFVLLGLDEQAASARSKASPTTLVALTG